MNLSDGQIDNADTNDFVEKVIEQSKNMPIIVDFWAPWCNPCKQLTPILEESVKERPGKVKLIKVNIDDNQSLAQQLRIQSVPTILAFFEGKPINGFAGIKSKMEVLEFLDELINSTAHTDNELNEILNLIEQAETNLDNQEIEKAVKIFGSLLSTNLPKKELIRVIKGLGKCYLESNRMDELLELMNNLDEEMKNSPEIESLSKAMDYFSNIPKPKQNLNDNNLEANPLDLELRLDIARAAILEKNYQKAVDHLLFIIEKNISWKNNIAKEELLTLFAYLGNSHEVTAAGRAKLSNILFK